MKRIIIVVAMLIFCVSAAFAGDYKEYTVKKGDTLSEIAWALKIPMQKMIEWNPEAGIHSVHPGQKLKYFLPDTTIQESNKKIVVLEELDLDKKIPEQNFDVQGEAERQWIVIGIFFAIIFLSLAIIISLNSRLERKTKDKIKIQIKDKEYIYYPQKVDNRYVSLYSKNDEFISFKNILDLRNSVKSSLKRNPALIEKEIDAGRLILKN